MEINAFTIVIGIIVVASLVYSIGALIFGFVKKKKADKRTKKELAEKYECEKEDK